MVWKDRGNLPSVIPLMLKSSDIVSTKYFDSCLVSWFPLLSNCGITYAKDFLVIWGLCVDIFLS